MVSFVIEAVPPPFWPPLIENKKLTLVGKPQWEQQVHQCQAMSLEGECCLSCYLKLFMMNDLFKRERMFNTNIKMAAPNVRSLCLSKGTLKTQFDLKTVLGLICVKFWFWLCEYCPVPQGRMKGGVYSVGRGGGWWWVRGRGSVCIMYQ